jgi:glutamine synthetase
MDSPRTRAEYVRDYVLPALERLRPIADHLERLVADAYWPLPSYREMLFVK